MKAPRAESVFYPNLFFRGCLCALQVGIILLIRCFLHGGIKSIVSRGELDPAALLGGELQWFYQECSFCLITAGNTRAHRTRNERRFLLPRHFNPKRRNGSPRRPQKTLNRLNFVKNLQLRWIH